LPWACFKFYTTINYLSTNFSFNLKTMLNFNKYHTFLRLSLKLNINNQIMLCTATLSIQILKIYSVEYYTVMCTNNNTTHCFNSEKLNTNLDLSYLYRTNWSNDALRILKTDLNYMKTMVPHFLFHLYMFTNYKSN